MMIFKIINIQLFVGLINNLYPNEFEILKQYYKLKRFNGFISSINEPKEDLSFKFLLLIKIFLGLNNLNLINNRTEGSFYNKFSVLLLDAKNFLK